eukprot:3752210-Rhodomonas_salina.1
MRRDVTRIRRDVTRMRRDVTRMRRDVTRMGHVQIRVADEARNLVPIMRGGALQEHLHLIGPKVHDQPYLRSRRSPKCTGAARSVRWVRVTRYQGARYCAPHRRARGAPYPAVLSSVTSQSLSHVAARSAPVAAFVVTSQPVRGHVSLVPGCSSRSRSRTCHVSSPPLSASRFGLPCIPGLSARCCAPAAH